VKVVALPEFGARVYMEQEPPMPGVLRSVNVV
jgi:hypothetical protein